MIAMTNNNNTLVAWNSHNDWCIIRASLCLHVQQLVLLKISKVKMADEVNKGNARTSWVIKW